MIDRHEGTADDHDAAAGRLGGGLRILVVDDNDVNRIVLQRLLAQLGHSSDTLSDGARAVTAAVDPGYDLLFLDLHMPVMDGISAARKIRELLGPAGPRLVALTGVTSPADQAACRDAGMDDFIAKPVEVRELQRVFAGLAANAGPVGAPRATADGVLDLERVGHLAVFSAGQLAELLALYAQRGSELVEELHQASGRGDSATMAMLAHTLRGTSASLGAGRLPQLCARIEQAASGGDLVEARLLLSAVAAEHVTLTDALSRRLHGAPWKEEKVTQSRPADRT